LAWGAPFLLAALILAARGIVFAPDSAAYAMWADRLIASGFDYAAGVREYGSTLSLTYALFVTLVAALKLLAGAWWPAALVAVNLAASATVGLLLTRLAWQLTGSGAASWTALILYLACLDIVQWAPFILSDSSFLLLAYTVFLMEAGRIQSRSGSWLPVFAASTAAALYRPTGFILLPITAWSLYLARSAGTGLSRPAAISCLALTGVATAMAFGWIMQDPGRWPFAFASAELDIVGRTYASGQVVWDRPETYHAPPALIWDFWAITADRFLHFFAPAAGNYSPAHKVAQYAFYIPVYGFAAYFVAMLAAGRSGLAKPRQDVCYAAFGAIMAYAAFHAMVQVDYDWRYRVPILPHLILLAAAGVATAARPASERRREGEAIRAPGP